VPVDAFWVTRIQLPPGSMTLNPLSPSLFFRARGRVIRGVPETSTLPYAARMPAAKSRYSCSVSEVSTRHEP
jgi:hypothetical protein